MIIDFHAHTFPDSIAAKTIEKLETVGHIKAFSDGRVSGLEESMKRSGVDISVVLPVVTNPAHITTVNRVAYETNQKFNETGIWSFGGIHPDNENYADELKAVADYGLKGIKLHPDYQNTFFDDIRYKRIIYKASELGLAISVHAGLDIGLPDPIHCTPDSVLEVIKDVSPENFILAHMGGFDLWDEVEEKLVDTGVLIDTAYCLDKMDKAQIIRMIESFGRERVLFATDTPWAGQKEYVNIFEGLGLSEDVKEYICHKNAQRILGI